MAMFENARDFEISGGTFIVEHGQNALQVLKEHAAPGAFHNSSERYDPPKCHPQTRLAVLDAIMDWLNDNEKTAFVIWLYGPAGAGKSTIAQTIAEICARLQILLASFFWSRNSHGRNDENRLITSLAYQLIVAIPQMRIHVESVIKNDPLIFSRSLETQMESLIVEPLGKTFPNNREQNADEEKPKLIILDGLDECGLPSAQAYILKVISTAVQRFPIPIYILIASRPEQEIRDSFNSQSLLSITTRIALDDTYHPDDDIRTFLVDNFTSLKATKVGSLLPAQWPTSEDVETLVKKSTGQFIYASTVLKFVKHPRRRPDKQLKIIFGISGAEKQTPFAELDTLYLHIFSTVEDLAQAHNILSCLFFFPSQYLIVEDIEKLLFYEHGELHLILSDLYSVVDVPDITDSDIPLRVFHASLQDFLMDPNRSGAFYLDEGITRAQLTQYFMRHIRNFPTVEMDPGTVDYLTSNMFVKNCLKSSPTKELIQDLLIFDFKQWVLTTCLNFLHPLQVFERVILLSAWFRIHESVTKQYFGPQFSLYDHHSHARDETINNLLSESLMTDYFSWGDVGELKMAAITHPMLLDSLNRSTMLNILRCRRGGITIRGQFNPDQSLFSDDEDGMGRDCILELQSFLLDRDRADGCYVSGETYSELALRIWKLLFNPTPQEGSLQDYYYDHLPETLQLAIQTLPFYLMKADYTTQLAYSLTRLKLHRKTLKEYSSDIPPLQEAIALYLRLNT